jgi:hypothetical protein
MGEATHANSKIKQIVLLPKMKKRRAVQKIKTKLDDNAADDGSKDASNQALNCETLECVAHLDNDAGQRGRTKRRRERRGRRRRRRRRRRRTKVDAESGPAAANGSTVTRAR